MGKKFVAHTDIGKKNMNQDAFSVYTAEGDHEDIWLAVLCDGMGGADKGEIASEGTVEAVETWFYNEMPKLLTLKDQNRDRAVKDSLLSIFQTRNEELIQIGEAQGKKIGTTASLILAIDNKIYIVHIGDSRIYRMTKKTIEQLTTDHSVVASEVRKGKLTPEQAKTDKRRNMLTQCIGIKGDIFPEYRVMEKCKKESFLLCSDGFVHEPTEEMIWKQLRPRAGFTEQKMKDALIELTNYSMEHGEKDNISSLLIYT